MGIRGYNFDGRMGEIVMFDRVLTHSERSAVTNYMTDKWIEDASSSSSSAVPGGEDISSARLRLRSTGQHQLPESTGSRHTSDVAFKFEVLKDGFSVTPPISSARWHRLSVLGDEKARAHPTEDLRRSATYPTRTALPFGCSSTSNCHNQILQWDGPS
jgi:hypothetical protein